MFHELLLPSICAVVLFGLICFLGRLFLEMTTDGIDMVKDGKTIQGMIVTLGGLVMITCLLMLFVSVICFVFAAAYLAVHGSVS